MEAKYIFDERIFDFIGPIRFPLKTIINLKNEAIMRRYSKRRMNRRKTRSKSYYTVSRGGIRL